MNALAKVDYPSSLPAPAISPIPAWRGRSHSPEGGVLPEGNLAKDTLGFPLLFFNLRLLWFMGSESCPDNLNGHYKQSFCFIFNKHFNCHSAMKVSTEDLPGKKVQFPHVQFCAFI